MAHYDRYLELLAQHNATGRAEDALQPLPCWDRSVARASAPKVLRYLHARGGEARRLAILLGDALASPSAAVAPSPLQAPPPSARAPAPDAPRPPSPRCRRHPMEVERRRRRRRRRWPSARRVGAGAASPPVAKRARRK